MEFCLELTVLLVVIGVMQYFIVRHSLKDVRKVLAEIKVEMKSEQARHEKRADHLYEICINLLQTRR